LIAGCSIAHVIALCTAVGVLHTIALHAALASIPRAICCAPVTPVLIMGTPVPVSVPVRLVVALRK